MDTQPLLSIEPAPKRPIDLFDQYRWHILAGLLVIGAVGIYLIFVPPKTTLAGSDVVVAKNDGVTTASTQTSATENTTPAAGQVVVDIAGAVKQPGVYHVASTSIIEDVITAAGGFASTADMNAIAHQINRAEAVTDHGKIYIPKKGEATLVYTSPASTSSTSSSPTATQPTGAKININTASESDLEVLPTIGPVLAQRIIDYRMQNGPFAKIEDIENVNGISDAKFAQFKDLITI